MLCFGFGFGPGFFFSRRLWIILIIFFSFLFFPSFELTIERLITWCLFLILFRFFFFSSFLLTIIFFLLSTDAQRRVVLSINWVSKQKHIFPAFAPTDSRANSRQRL